MNATKYQVHEWTIHEASIMIIIITICLSACSGGDAGLISNVQAMPPLPPLGQYYAIQWGGTLNGIMDVIHAGPGTYEFAHVLYKFHIFGFGFHGGYGLVCLKECDGFLKWSTDNKAFLMQIKDFGLIKDSLETHGWKVVGGSEAVRLGIAAASSLVSVAQMVTDFFVLVVYPGVQIDLPGVPVEVRG